MDSPKKCLLKKRVKRERDLIVSSKSIDKQIKRLSADPDIISVSDNKNTKPQRGPDFDARERIMAENSDKKVEAPNRATTADNFARGHCIISGFIYAKANIVAV